MAPQAFTLHRLKLRAELRVMPQYSYSKLSPSRNTIRLLRLLPNENRLETLRCEIFEYSILESDVAVHPYEALSYVWGGENRPESVSIRNQDLAVTPNLYKALLRLRDPLIPRIIWIDAVCINQADDKEKERQIELMAAIYAKASRVLVWLGEARDGSDQALESIRIAGETSTKPGNAEWVQHVIPLLKRSWFHRIWVSICKARIISRKLNAFVDSSRDGCSSTCSDHV
jgi:hypothetical protein